MLVRCILALLFLLLTLPAAAQSEKEEAQGPPPALVVTAAVQEKEIRSPLSLVGSAEAKATATVAGEVAGRVASIAVEEGDHIERDDTLLRLRTLPLELELQETRALLEEVQARQQKAADDVRRAEQLFAEGFISEEELQAQQTEQAALQKQAQRLRATLKKLRDRLGRMHITAPFSGRVIDKRTEVGQWVGVGAPVITLADLSTIKIKVPVPERHIAQIDRGKKAKVTFAGLSENSFTGEVTAIIPQADTAARTFPVEISLSNRKRRIMAGMLAEVTFGVGAPRTALVVSKDALVPQPGGDAHLFKLEEGKAAIVPVRTIGTHEDLYAVESLGPPLKKGDRVIVRGNERVRPGQAVREAGRQKQ